MRNRTICRVLILCTVVVFGGPHRFARADELPAIQIQIRSLESLMASLQEFQRSAGQKEFDRQMELMKALSINEFAGVDAKKPLALYANIAPDLVSSTGAIMVPVKDEKAVLNQVQKLTNLEPQKEGALYVYRPQSLPFPIFVRFADGYAYVTIQDSKSLDDGSRIRPDKIFAKPLESMMGFRLQVDRIPEQLRRQSLIDFRGGLEDGTNLPLPNETALQRTGRETVAKIMLEAAQIIIRDAREFAVYLDLNSKGQDVSLDLRLGAKPGSQMAAAFARMPQHRSPFQGWIRSDSAFHILVSSGYSEAVRKLVGLAADSQFTSIPPDGEPERADRLRAGAQAFSGADSLEFALDLRGPGPGGTYTLLGACTVKPNAKYESQVEDIWKAIPPHQRTRLKLSSSPFGRWKLYEIADVDGTDDALRSVFGKAPMGIAMSKETVIYSNGDEKLQALKAAAQTAPEPAPIIRVGLNAARLAPLFKNWFPNAEPAQKAFSKPDDGRAQLTITGGNELKIRLEVKWALLNFVSKLVDSMHK